MGLEIEPNVARMEFTEYGKRSNHAWCLGQSQSLFQSIVLPYCAKLHTGYAGSPKKIIWLLVCEAGQINTKAAGRHDAQTIANKVRKPIIERIKGVRLE